MFTIQTSLRAPADDVSSDGGANPFAPNSSSAPEPTTPAPSVESRPSAAPSTPAAAPQSAPSAPTRSAPSAPSQVVMSSEQLQQLAASMRQPAAPAAQGAPQMSEADFKKQFNVFEADSKSYENTFGVQPTPAQLAAYNDHLQAVARQAVTINRHLMDQRIDELRNQFQPVQQQFRQQSEQQVFNDFVVDYPGLKEYGPLLREITDAAVARKMQFDSIPEAKQFVAAQAAKLLGKHVDSFRAAPSSPSTQTTSQQSGNRSMSTTSMGGRSGASGGAAPTQSTAERLFQGAS